MQAEPPTMRDHMLAAIRGEPTARLPFALLNNLVAPNDEIWKLIGEQQVGILRPVHGYHLHNPHCQWHRQDVDVDVDGRPCACRILHTPNGELRQERSIDHASGPSRIHRHFLRRVGDYELLLDYLRHVEVHSDLESIDAAVAAVGDHGLTPCLLPRTPYQQLLMEWVDPEALNWHLLEAPTLVFACIEQMARVHLEIYEIIRTAPIPYAIFPDSIHAPLLGRTCFNKYCVWLYNRLAELLSERNCPVFVRMDGDLKPLWYDIEDLQIGGIDALAPPPEHDTSITQARTLWPNLSLTVEFPATTFLKPASIVYDKAFELAQQAYHSGRTLLTVTRHVPPNRWRVALPAICRAIEDAATQ